MKVSWVVSFFLMLLIAVTVCQILGGTDPRIFESSEISGINLRGPKILEELIKKGILQDYTTVCVRLERIPLDEGTEIEVRSIAKVDFDKVWGILENHSHDEFSHKIYRFFGGIFCQTFFWSLFLIPFYLSMKDVYCGFKSKGWPKVQGVVTSSQVLQKDSYGKYGSVIFYIPQISYEYTVDGNKFTSDNISILKGLGGSESESSANAFIYEFPVQSTVNVFYNPSSPADALLKPGIPVGHLVFCLSIMILVSLIPIWIIYYQYFRHAMPVMSDDAANFITNLVTK